MARIVLVEFAFYKQEIHKFHNNNHVKKIEIRVEKFP